MKQMTRRPLILKFYFTKKRVHHTFAKFEVRRPSFRCYDAFLV